jgi:MraZ protein
MSARKRMLLGAVETPEVSPEGIVLPRRFRSVLERGFVMTRGIERCVAVFPVSEWDSLLQRIESGPSFLRRTVRQFERHLYGGAVAGSLRPEGTVEVPGHLRDYAGLGDRVVIIGLGNRLEIWNAQAWSEQESRITEQAEQVAEAVSQYGV